MTDVWTDVWIVPPNYVSQLCGCKYACLMDRNRVRLVYLDDTKEDAIIPESERVGWSERGNRPDSFFALVSAVQSKRKTIAEHAEDSQEVSERLASCPAYARARAAIAKATGETK